MSKKLIQHSDLQKFKRYLKEEMKYECQELSVVQSMNHKLSQDPKTYKQQDSISRMMQFIDQYQKNIKTAKQSQSPNKQSLYQETEQASADQSKAVGAQQDSLCEHGSVIEQTPQKIELLDLRKTGSSKKKEGQIMSNQKNIDTQYFNQIRV